MEKDRIYYKTVDIMEMFDCGKNKAHQMINMAKHHNDRIGIKGKILKTDFHDWLEYRKPLEKKDSIFD